MRQPDENHFGSTGRARGVFRFRYALQQHLPDARKRGDRNRVGKFRTAHAFYFRKRGIFRCIRHIFHAGHEMGEIGEIVKDHNRVRARLILTVEFRQSGRDIAFDDMLEEIDDAGPVGKTEHAAYRFSFHPATTMGDCLIEQRQAVTGRPFRRAGDHRKRLRFGFETFLAGDGGKKADEIGGADAAQVETLAS